MIFCNRAGTEQDLHAIIQTNNMMCLLLGVIAYIYCSCRELLNSEI